MALFPEQIEGRGVLLRRWRPSDAEELHRAISESAEHLTPWLRFMQRPQTLEAHRQKIADSSRAFDSGGDAEYGVFAGGALAGAASLLPRRGPGTLEIGYWIHVGWLRRGLALEASRLLMAAAFAVPSTEAVEIHHDGANAASEAIPRRLGFRIVEEVPVETGAPRETGIDRIWRLTRAEFLADDPG